MFFDWIMGVALRPGTTFERSREQLRFGYWWIVLAVISLEAVVGIYRPVNGLGTENWPDAAFWVLMYDLVLFDVQALFLLGAGRLLRWQLTWADATKLCGLVWSVIFLEDLFNFYPALKGLEQLEVYISAVFSLWYVIVMLIGIRKVSGLTMGKSLLVTLMAGVTWRGGVLALAFWAIAGK
ncbi:MAG TPA: hypothetical protein VNT01_15465 [Symbiobacteriaceae bacterium]|nr:hypothetical protein [Symbiobacteriaceae bacterium]